MNSPRIGLKPALGLVAAVLSLAACGGAGCCVELMSNYAPARKRAKSA